MLTALPSLSFAAEQIRDGRLTPLDLVEHCLERIARLEDQIHAWVLVDAAGARRAAEESAREIQRGNWRGPLHGIPIGIKDIIDVAGLPTRAGSRLRESHIATCDAPIVTRLRECGAIVLGKTVTTEFACFDPPPTRNPWNLEHTPGGSSSGSAAAVAALMCPLALGSQTGGSITRPAAYCGVAGLKPRYGALPLDGIIPLAHHLDHPGPLARTAADLRVFWRAFHNLPQVEEKSRRAQVERFSVRLEVETGTSAFDDSDSVSRPPRLLKLEGFFRDEASPDVRTAVAAALDKLAHAGAQVVPHDWPEIAAVHAAHRRIMSVEAAEYHRAGFLANPGAYGPRVSELIAEGLATSAVDYAAALAAQRNLKRTLTQWLPSLQADAFVLPATNTTAPGRDTTGDPKFNSPWSYSGLPAVNIPCGLAPLGLPCGLQLIGLTGESALLDAAVWCEEWIGPLATPKVAL